MAYAVLRTAKLKTAGNIGGLNAHLIRSKEVPNADKDLSKHNSRPIGSADLWADVQKRIEQAGITKIRKDGVLAVEHLMTASPEHFNAHTKQGASGNKVLWLNTQRWQAFQQTCIEWLKERYGAKNVVNVTCHLDEQTPHIHAIIVPIDSKGKLNCKSFLGGREKLRDMQTSFAQAHAEAGLQRGVEGSQAHHTTVKQFYAHAQAFEQAPAVELPKSAPVARLQAPETTFLNTMLESKQNYVTRQEERLNKQWKEQYEENIKNAQKQAQELHQAAKVSEALHLENQRLKGQLKGLEEQVKQLSEQVKEVTQQCNRGKILMEYLVSDQVSLSEVKQALTYRPKPDDKRQNYIRSALAALTIPFKQEEVKQSQIAKKDQDEEQTPQQKYRGPRR